MQNSAPRLIETRTGLSPDELERWAEGWLLDGTIRGQSNRTIDSRRDIVQKLVWFLRRDHLSADLDGMRAYMMYLHHGHLEPGGRWGNPEQTYKLRPATIHTYHGHLRTLFRWLLAERLIAVNPMERIPVPIYRRDQVEPLTQDELRRIIMAAKSSFNPKRDEAIIRLLLDTGIRVSELIGLRREDISVPERTLRVVGKGGKRRVVAYGARTSKALWAYLGEIGEDGQPVFRGERGPLTRSGVGQIVSDLGDRACVERVHAHRLRHTFAIEFLRANGNVFTLQQILGHTNLQMTQRYVAIAQADVVVQQRRFSPGDRL